MLQPIIGYLCDRVPGKSLEKALSENHLTRVVTLTQLLQHYGLRLFLYSPADVNFERNLVQGYFYHKKAFVPDMVSVPKINANGIEDITTIFERYPNYEFYPDLKINDNKYTIYQIFKLFDQNSVPHTEIFTQKPEQVEAFMTRSSLIFLKPIEGNNNKDIITINRHHNDYILKLNSQQEIFEYLDKLVNKLLQLTQNKHYIIQQGIHSTLYHQHGFDVCILMGNDGKNWHWFNKKSDTDNPLVECFGKDESEKILQKLYANSYRMLRFLQCFYYSEFAEISFDYIIDQELNFYLLETNIKPELLNFSETPAHLTRLASFFSNQWQNYSKRQHSNCLSEIKHPLILTNAEIELLKDATWQHLIFKRHLEDYPLPAENIPCFVVVTVTYSKDKKCIAYGSGDSLLTALKQAINRIFVRYQYHSELNHVELELVNEVVFSGEVDLSKPLTKYEKSFGIAFEPNLQLCFSPLFIEQEQVIDSKNQFNFGKALKFYDYHPVNMQNLQRIQRNPIQKITYFKTQKIIIR